MVLPVSSTTPLCGRRAEVGVGRVGDEDVLVTPLDRPETYWKLGLVVPGTLVPERRRVGDADCRLMTPSRNSWPIAVSGPRPWSASPLMLPDCAPSEGKRSIRPWGSSGVVVAKCVRVGTPGEEGLGGLAGEMVRFCVCSGVAVTDARARAIGEAGRRGDAYT